MPDSGPGRILESDPETDDSPIIEADGWLYFTTHLANYWEEAQKRYPGAHVLGYQLETERFRDFGVVRPRFSIYSAIGVDPERGRLYVFVVPFAAEEVENDGGYVYRIDIETGEAFRPIGCIGATSGPNCICAACRLHPTVHSKSPITAGWSTRREGSRA